MSPSDAKCDLPVMWLCDSATPCIILVPSYALAAGRSFAWLAAGWAWPWLTRAGPGWLGLALAAHTARTHETHSSPPGAKRTRAARLGSESYSQGASKSRLPTSQAFGAEEPWHMAWGGARPALAAKTTTPSPPARTCSVGGRLVLDEAKRALAARNGIR